MAPSIDDLMGETTLQRGVKFTLNGRGARVITFNYNTIIDRITGHGPEYRKLNEGDVVTVVDPEGYSPSSEKLNPSYVHITGSLKEGPGYANVYRRRDLFSGRATEQEAPSIRREIG